MAEIKTVGRVIWLYTDQVTTLEQRTISLAAERKERLSRDQVVREMIDDGLRNIWDFETEDTRSSTDEKKKVSLHFYADQWAELETAAIQLAAKRGKRVSRDGLVREMIDRGIKKPAD